MSQKQIKREHASVDRQGDKIIAMFLHEACEDTWRGRRKFARQIMKKEFLEHDPRKRRLYSRMFNRYQKGKDSTKVVEDHKRNEKIKKRDAVLKEAAYTAEYLGAELARRDKFGRKKAFRLDANGWVKKARGASKTRIVIENNKLEKIEKKRLEKEKEKK